MYPPIRLAPEIRRRRPARDQFVSVDEIVYTHLGMKSLAFEIVRHIRRALPTDWLLLLGNGGGDIIWM
jgi:hypothetical protein